MPELTAANLNFISNNPEVLAKLREMAAAKQKASTSPRDKAAPVKRVRIVSPVQSKDNGGDEESDEEENEAEQTSRVNPIGADDQAFFAPMADDKDDNDDEEEESEEEDNDEAVNEPATSVPSSPTPEPTAPPRPTTRSLARPRPATVRVEVAEESDGEIGRRG